MNMQSIAINAIVMLVRSMMDKKVFDELESLIIEFGNTDMPGEEKRKRVLEHLKDLNNLLLPAVAATASWMLNLALEALVAKLKKV